MKKNFPDAVNEINQNCAVWMTYTAFNKKIKCAREHLNELKEIELELPTLTKNLNLGKLDNDETGKTVDAYYKNLVPCIVEIKAAIECLKLCLAIKYADETYFKWEDTLSKIYNALSVPIDQLADIESNIKDLRNFLVHAGSPLFTFNNTKLKFTVPKYNRLHLKLTIPTIKKGKLEIVDLLETALKRMEEFSKHLEKKHEFFIIDKTEISEDWSK
uniref:Uncharacterized protein n=1 Tax=Candidatus Methanophagaceae archaeon ANME-1 ERB6 TaxID=2759912 RepID=A0A7G9Z1A4_9EURY|nr:hypothetical protein KFAGBJAM_00020 [Methanosarcinales archaeon ANME-1 ERB6]